MKRVSFAILFPTREAVHSPALVIDCHRNIIYHLDWIVCVEPADMRLVLAPAPHHHMYSLTGRPRWPSECGPPAVPAGYVSVEYVLLSVLFATLDLLLLRRTLVEGKTRGRRKKTTASLGGFLVGGGLCEKFKDSLFIGWAIFRMWYVEI